ncbi:hypothetical protein [Streptomyces sulphureus]|uniref:hypothetical protein n=1 Tax=Streptomyces sulphureus TaxID=47758 RepID=UPI000D0AB74C|nr:hypothetical protein [Streptomyces sulphureus]
MNPAVQSRDVDLFLVVEALREALDQVGIVLPSLRADVSSGLVLVGLGRVWPDVADLLVRVVREGSGGTGELTCPAALGSAAGGQVRLSGGAVS